MAYVLSFRRDKRKFIEEIKRFLEENPGIKWSQYIPIRDSPIKYLEIGVHKGENIVTVARSYCKHKDSVIYCIDPWEDYDEYFEYKTQQTSIFATFTKNIEPFKEKCKIIRGFSEIEVPNFEDNFFDIVYIDGNHETEYVYKDAVLSLQKVKVGGYIIFDDYELYNWYSVIKGVEMFVTEYKNQIEIIANPTDCLEKYGHCPQFIVKKIA
jgi:hypothetical protein